jgi:uncharacterized protein YdeI (YjbR/CyaY-like superfamily)
MAKSPAKTFKATLERGHASLGWTIIRVPRQVTDAWQTRDRLRVKGEISRDGADGFAFRTSLFPTGDGNFTLLVNKRMQAAAGVALGSVATFRLEPDMEVREVGIPAELKKVLSEMPSLRRWYDRLPYSIRKYVTDIVTAPKSPEACTRRAQMMAEHLLSMQEGERETPPILQAAFVRAPLARKGWDLMTPNQRRGHLWGIFYYRSPEARQRRTDKAVEDAIRIAKSKAQKGKDSSPSSH